MPALTELVLADGTLVLVCGRGISSAHSGLYRSSGGTVSAWLPNEGNVRLRPKRMPPPPACCSTSRDSGRPVASPQSKRPRWMGRPPRLATDVARYVPRSERAAQRTAERLDESRELATRGMPDFDEGALDAALLGDQVGGAFQDVARGSYPVRRRGGTVRSEGGDDVLRGGAAVAGPRG